MIKIQRQNFGNPPIKNKPFPPKVFPLKYKDNQLFQKWKHIIIDFSTRQQFLAGKNK